MKLSLTAGLFACLCFASPAVAQLLGPNAPDSLSFQGLITRDDGTPLDSNEVSFTFSLYKGGTKVWEEVQQVDVIDGLIDVQLGKVTPLDTVAFNRPMELGVKLGIAPEISPRTTLSGSAFALGMRGMSGIMAESSNLFAMNLVGGSWNNAIAAEVAGGVISGGGGWQNSIGGIDLSNSVSANYGTVGGGFLNIVSGFSGTVGGGRENIASGISATVAGGYKNAARGDYSMAAGFNARPHHAGSFVWGDRSSASSADSLITTAPNQFLIEAEGGVGINTNAPANALHVARSVSASASVGNHVAVIDNTSTGTGADVLALRVGRSSAPQATNAFITFKYNGNSSAGFIRGDGTGGIELVSEGADYAEYLPHRSADEVLEPGDVVGVFGGEISLQTGGADQIMAVSTSPIVVGNHSRLNADDESGISPVAFIGQAPVKVRGAVSSGDFLIPSGLADGTAAAIHPADIRPDQLDQVFATAWESRTGTGLGLVNAAVGIEQAAASQRVIEALHERVAAMDNRLSALEARLMP